jgi:transposase
LLLGLEGLEVCAVVRRADRTRVVEVITVDPNASRCPDCGMSSASVKERTTTSPRDIRYGDDPIVLRWNKTRYRCRNDTNAGRWRKRKVPGGRTLDVDPASRCLHVSGTELSD